MRRASLIAGAGIFLVGLGALAFVRPWGLRLPRALVIIPGADRVGLRCVARADRVRDEPLHAAGVVELQFHGWAQRDEPAQFAWDLPFYEPWFLGLAVLVTLGALHHHRRTGGCVHGERQLLLLTALATLGLTAFAGTVVVARSL